MNIFAICETKIDKHDGTFINEIGVKNVEILVDGQPVYDENGNQELTDINGYFNIKVPIDYMRSLSNLMVTLLKIYGIVKITSVLLIMMILSIIQKVNVPFYSK